MKPIVTVPHRATVLTHPTILADTIHLFRYIHAPFLSLMAALYPRFASYTAAEEGYSAFVNGEFVGCFAGKTLQSIRKNPWFEDNDQWFLRSLLAGLHVDGYDHHTSVCSPYNYGTLRLWQRMGLGSRYDARGKARSVAATEESLRQLQVDIDRARPEYAEIRAFAERQMRAMSDAALQNLLPRYRDMPGVPAVVTVELL